MKINEITINNQTVVAGHPLAYSVGTAVTINIGEISTTATVEKIIYCSPTRIFNKGLETSKGCYVVYFTEIEERRLIMEDVVTSVLVIKEASKAQKSANSEADVGLPE